jgi:hypothetical protein
MVGSRRRTDRETIEAAIAELPAGAVVISCGAVGPERERRMLTFTSPAASATKNNLRLSPGSGD